ncbi:MAG: helix-turn-helix transcriptional regulator [Ruminococcaceae bacterium]|nr:helix-turn-helix transcriptional regulator [Oscillospiraceae bacterium]
MTDKKTFGLFIRLKRIEKNYSQRDLAEMLFVTEGAVSKWERGVSYPDITLIADICRVLEVSEHELITASTDMDSAKIKREARKFRVIRSAWFWVPTISYAVALLVCFICNLAVNHTLSWFFIVLAALLCAYTFVPTVTYFFESRRLLAFTASTYLSICLLLLVCAIYVGDLSWLLTACIGILIGYELLFVPVLLSSTGLSRYKLVISFSAAWLLTVLLLMNIRIWYPFRLAPAIWLTCYCFAPVVLCAVLCTFRADAFLKTGVCIVLSAVVYYFTNGMVDLLFDMNEHSYRVNFSDWQQYTGANVQCVVFVSLAVIGVAFIGWGVFRICKGKRP